jgi:hypothetical protein
MWSFHKCSQRTCLVLLRLCKHAHVIYLAAPLLFSRTMASSSSPSNLPPPAERTAEIIDKLRSYHSLIAKTSTAILQELYVLN